MRTYDEQFRQEVFNLIPMANFISVNIDDRCFWHYKKPLINAGFWNGDSNDLGKVIPTCNWKDSLFERKWVPNENDIVWICTISNTQLVNDSYWYNYIRYQKHLLDNNLVFKTKEEAIARSKQLLGIE